MLMAKHRRPNKTGRGGESRHVRLHHWTMGTPAWRSLDPAGRALLVELYKLFNGTNNGALFLSVRDAAAALNVGKNTAARAFRDLVNRGFIRAKQSGAFTWKARHATCWTFTEFAAGDDLAAKDFARWQPPANSNDGPIKETNCPPAGTDPTAKHAARNKVSKSVLEAGQIAGNPGEICPATETHLSYQGGATR